MKWRLTWRLRKGFVSGIGWRFFSIPVDWLVLGSTVPDPSRCDTFRLDRVLLLRVDFPSLMIGIYRQSLPSTDPGLSKWGLNKDRWPNHCHGDPRLHRPHFLFFDNYHGPHCRPARTTVALGHRIVWLPSTLRRSATCSNGTKNKIKSWYLCRRDTHHRGSQNQ